MMNRPRKMILLVLGLGGFAALFIMGAAVGLVRNFSFFDWQEVQPDRSDLAVMMPGRPQIVGPFATQVFKAGSLQSIQKIVYQSEVDGGEARFSIIEAPKELSFNDQALTEFLNEELSTTKSTLVSKRDITLGGYS